jgi:type I restriction enzyme S subunit
VSGLPTGWSIRPVADIATFGRKKPAELRDSQEKVAFLPMAAVEEISGLIARDQTITHAAAQKKTLTFFEEGDILFAKVTPCMENGKIARATSLLGGCGYGSTEFHVIVPGPDIQPDYLRYFLVNDDFRSEAERAMTGAVGLRRVPKAFIEKYPIPVPPLDVQQRIVETLEEHLSRLDKALAELESARSKLLVYLRSFAHKVLNGYGDEKFGWSQTTLGDIARWSSGGTPSAKTNSYYGGGIPWAVIGDLTEGLVQETAQTITQLGLERSSAKIQPEGTVMLVMYGASIGRTGIAGIPLATNQAIACAQVDESAILPRFLLHFLQSQKDAFVRAGQGGAQPNISQGIIKAWPISVPPLENQSNICDLLDSEVELIKHLSDRVDSQLEQIATLRRSLLHAAFTGQLTNEEPND